MRNHCKHASPEGICSRNGKDMGLALCRKCMTVLDTNPCSECGIGVVFPAASPPRVIAHDPCRRARRNRIARERRAARNQCAALTDHGDGPRCSRKTDVPRGLCAQHGVTARHYIVVRFDRKVVQHG